MTAIDERCATCLVRDKALCASLTDSELFALGSIGHTKILARGDALIWAGDDNVVCANLVSGVVQMTTATSDGREQIVGMLYPGDFVGQPFAAEATLTFGALTEAELCVYPRNALVGALAKHTALERLLFHPTIAALDEARLRMLTLGRRTAGERVAGFMVELSQKLPVHTNHDGVQSFVLPLDRAQTGDLLGLTIETVSRQLTRLRNAGAIALSGRRNVTILDLAELKKRAGAAHI